EESPGDTEALLSAIARQTGGINRRGDTDYGKVAQTLLNDYRSGKLGNHTLELPPAGTD
ncbi:MAG TPA: ribosome biogenesis GTPase YlqF, partial [Gammaproteobacteria bacterium]|nr:ribosome biogenesis GTPase YlqF [Gammaproteobacteria bacterium]